MQIHCSFQHINSLEAVEKHWLGVREELESVIFLSNKYFGLFDEGLEKQNWKNFLVLKD